MPSSLRPVSLSVFLLAGACACATASRSRELPPGTVVLRFAWPETFSAKVTHAILTGDSRGEREYWWKAEPGKEQGQRRLVVRAGEAPGPGLAALADPESTVLFDAQGAFLDYEPPQDSAAQGLLEAFPLSPEQQAQVRQMLDESQRKVARARWEQRVQHWRDVAIAPGETVRFKTRMWVGQNAFAHEEVDAEERTTLEVGVPCAPEAPDKRCVRLRVETVPDHPYKEDEPCERARGVKRFELVTEPDTLLPHMTRMVREDEMDSCRDDGTVTTRRMVQGEEFVFTYGLEPAPAGTWSLWRPGGRP